MSTGCEDSPVASSSRGSSLRLETPARASHVLDVAGPNGWVRKALIAQKNTSETIAITEAGLTLAVAFLRYRGRRAFLALAIHSAAAANMRRLIRLTHLTVGRFAQNGILVIAKILPENRQGQRMARLAGFRPAKLKDGETWVWRGHETVR